MQLFAARKVLAFALAAFWTMPASAHAGGAEAAPLVGIVVGFTIGIIVGAVPKSWRRKAIVVAFILLLSPIIYLILKEHSSQTNFGVAAVGWLALGFSFFLVPAGLSGLAGYACLSWVKRAAQFNRKHGSRPQAKCRGRRPASEA